jgi:hypothetical protein
MMATSLRGQVVTFIIPGGDLPPILQTLKMLGAVIKGLAE